MIDLYNSILLWERKPLLLFLVLISILGSLNQSGYRMFLFIVCWGSSFCTFLFYTQTITSILYKRSPCFSYLVNCIPVWMRLHLWPLFILLLATHFQATDNTLLAGAGGWFWTQQRQVTANLMACNSQYNLFQVHSRFTNPFFRWDSWATPRCHISTSDRCIWSTHLYLSCLRFSPPYHF